MDWISARLGCSLEHAWITLRETIKSDVARWRELQPDRAKNLELTSDDSWIVVSTTPARFPHVLERIEVKASQIVVNDGRHETDLIPSLNAKGECA
jgi:hypothetical protein